MKTYCRDFPIIQFLMGGFVHVRDIQRSYGFVRPKRDRSYQDLPGNHQKDGGEFCKNKEFLLCYFRRFCRADRVKFFPARENGRRELPCDSCSYVVHGCPLPPTGANVPRSAQSHRQRLSAQSGQLDVLAEKSGRAAYLEADALEFFNRHLPRRFAGVNDTLLCVNTLPRSSCRYFLDRCLSASCIALSRIPARGSNTCHGIGMDRRRAYKVHPYAISSSPRGAR